MFPYVCSLLIPSTLFQYAFFHSVPPITPLKPNAPFHSFPVLLSPLGPSLYSVKTKSPFHSFPVLLSSLRPSHYPVKTKSPLLLFFSIAFSTGSLPLLRQNQIHPFTLFQYGIAFSIKSLSLLRENKSSLGPSQSFVPFSVTCPHVYSLPPFPSFPELLSLLGPSHYPVKPHYAHYKQFQIQKLHVHLDDVNKKNYYMTRAYIVHVQ